MRGLCNSTRNRKINAIYQMQNLRSLFATINYLGASLSQSSTHIRHLSLFPKIPPSIIVQHQTIPTKTPEHHNNPEVERLLKTQLCGFPPYEARKRWFFYLFRPNLAV
ncbi:hypothetical protein X801_09883 [Opisthorchis viverrini]|uniref:Uncharacterized protein n=1 Tax=Opisthorchis viverrini TaxID=6198 RepID=A0A1S8WIR9_OPIVI|nr:hypothetical protein X801_09883 [Opisthorchis viverrini]